MEIYMPIKDVKKNYARQCSLYLSLIRKHIIDVRGMSVFACPGVFLDLCIYERTYDYEYKQREKA